MYNLYTRVHRIISYTKRNKAALLNNIKYIGIRQQVYRIYSKGVRLDQYSNIIKLGGSM